MGTTSKALSLLDLFSRTTPSIGLSDLARRSGLNKATVHRLMGELAAHGFVEQAGAAREYRLGPAVLRLAQLREAAVPMREVVRPVLTALAAETGETAHVSLVQGGELVLFDFAYSQAHGTQVMMGDAPVLALHATSSGLAVLAFSEPAFVDRALSGPLAAYTAKTRTDPAELRAALAPVRRAGLAESEGGFETDVHSHAMPLFDVHRHCIGAVAVAAPAARMTPALRETIRAALRREAPRLTAALGGVSPEDFPQAGTEPPAARDSVAAPPAPIENTGPARRSQTGSTR